jgi:hypothetical protein
VGVQAEPRDSGDEQGQHAHAGSLAQLPT